jgi:hypothetical protein
MAKAMAIETHIRLIEILKDSQEIPGLSFSASDSSVSS